MADTMTLWRAAQLMAGVGVLATAMAAVDVAHAQAPAAPPAAGAADKAAPKRRGPADAAASIETGIKQLEAGRAEQAVQALSYAISGGTLPPTQMARALHHRGAAYRKLNKPAQAISDLTSALWLKNGLDPAARTDAMAQRTEAYREAGLAQPVEAAAGASASTTDAPSPRPASTRSAGSGTGSGTNPAAAASASLAADGTPAAPSPNPIGNLFSGFFGGAGGAAAPAVAPATAPAPKAEPATSGWTSTTTAKATPGTARVATAAITPPAAAVAPRAPVTAAPAAPDGRYHARLGSFTSKAEADTTAARLASQFGSALSGRAPQTDQMTFGGRTIWHLRVGPYTTAAQATAACGQLKASALDCVAVDR